MSKRLKIFVRQDGSFDVLWNEVQEVLGNHITAPVARTDVLMSFDPRSQEPYNVWWEEARRKFFPPVRGDIVLHRKDNHWGIREMRERWPKAFSSLGDYKEWQKPLRPLRMP